MTRFQDWTMRNAAQILFWIAVVVFLIGFGQAIVGLKSTVGEASVAGEPISQAALQWLMLLSGTFAAFSSAALPFAAAAIIFRWDRHTKPGPE